MFSLTPATRQASIVRKSAARACRICLKTTRLATCSPTAIRTGWTASPDGGQAENLIRAASAPRPSTGRTGRARTIAEIGLPDAPALVRVDGDADIRSHGLPGQRQAAGIVLVVGADLQLDLAEPVGDRLPGQPDELVVGVADPAGRGGVGGVAGALQLGDPLARGPRGPARRMSSASRRGERVIEVAEVDQRRRPARASCRRAAATAACLRRLAARSQAALTTAPMAMCMTPFSGPEPAQLAVADQLGAELAELADDLRHGPADDVRAAAPRSPATTTSLPRPIVKHSPCPAVRRASVRSTHRRPSSPGPGSSRPIRRVPARSGSARRSSRAPRSCCRRGRRRPPTGPGWSRVLRAARGSLTPPGGETSDLLIGCIRL